jgi:hypothetical protein
MHIFSWFKRHRDRCKDAVDDAKSGCSLNAQNLETVAKICEMVSRDP